mmetsp:Transcript_30282/g.96590  ORF Transcript_30282/g.96590 Transcript_30282/m.96590 type:complete len:247 (-) Transcript_30282:85-825(-)
MRYSSGLGYGAAGGYTPYGVEAVGRTHDEGGAVPDLVENFVFQKEVQPPDILPDLIVREARAYWGAVSGVSDLLLRLSAAALDLTDDYFADYYSGDPANALRLAHYPKLAGLDAGAGAERYGAHTDYQGFTILWQDPERQGVEVKMADGRWEPVATAEDAFVVNAGDLIELWTNGRWKSTLHRVPQPAPGSAASATSRLSLVFFTGPNHSAYIEPIATCISEENPSRYEPVLAGDHLLRKLQASNT